MKRHERYDCVLFCVTVVRCLREIEVGSLFRDLRYFTIFNFASNDRFIAQILCFPGAIVRTCFYEGTIYAARPIRDAFCFTVNVKRAAFYVQVVFTVCFDGVAIFVLLTSNALRSMYVFRTCFLSQDRTRVFLQDVFRGIFTFGPRFATRFSYVTTYFQVFQVVGYVRLFCFSLKVINGGRFRQVRCHEGANDANIRIFACDAFRRDGFVRDVVDDMTGFIGRLASEL